VRNEDRLYSGRATGPSEIVSYLKQNYPASAHLVQARIRIVLTRISYWPDSAREISERPGVRVVPLVRYPYKIFYRVVDETVEILHIYHTSRREPWGDRP
jgi:toxin ParE1/3/4